MANIRTENTTQYGWVQVNNTVVPHVTRHLVNDMPIQLVPLPVIQCGARLLRDEHLQSLLATDVECEALNKACKDAGLNFVFENCVDLVPLYDVIKKSRKTTVSVLPDKDPFGNAKFKPDTRTSQIRNNYSPEQVIDLTDCVLDLSKGTNPVEQWNSLNQDSLKQGNKEDLPDPDDVTEIPLDLSRRASDVNKIIPDVAILSSCFPPNNMERDEFQMESCDVMHAQTQVRSSDVMHAQTPSQIEPSNNLHTQPLPPIVQSCGMHTQTFQQMIPSEGTHAQAIPQMTPSNVMLTHAIPQMPPRNGMHVQTLLQMTPSNGVYIRPIKIHRRTIPCIIKAGIQYVLVETVRKAYFPQCSLRAFMFVVERCTSPFIYDLDQDDIDTIMRFAKNPTSLMKCSKVVSVRDATQMLPIIRKFFVRVEQHRKLRHSQIAGQDSGPKRKLDLGSLATQYLRSNVGTRAIPTSLDNLSTARYSSVYGSRNQHMPSKHIHGNTSNRVDSQDDPAPTTSHTSKADNQNQSESSIASTSMVDDQDQPGSNLPKADSQAQPGPYIVTDEDITIDISENCIFNAASGSDIASCPDDQDTRGCTKTYTVENRSSNPDIALANSVVKLCSSEEHLISISDSKQLTKSIDESVVRPTYPSVHSKLPTDDIPDGLLSDCKDFTVEPRDEACYSTRASATDRVTGLESIADPVSNISQVIESNVAKSSDVSSMEIKTSFNNINVTAQPSCTVKVSSCPSIIHPVTQSSCTATSSTSNTVNSSPIDTPPSSDTIQMPLSSGVIGTSISPDTDSAGVKSPSEFKKPKGVNRRHASHGTCRKTPYTKIWKRREAMKLKMLRNHD